MSSSFVDGGFPLKHNFERRLCYETVIHFLLEYYGISINVKTLKRRITV